MDISKLNEEQRKELMTAAEAMGKEYKDDKEKYDAFFDGFLTGHIWTLVRGMRRHAEHKAAEEAKKKEAEQNE